MFFGSAMSNFGVELFLKTFLDLARSPVGRAALSENTALPLAGNPAAPESAGELQERIIAPDSDEFSGFVFKLQVRNSVWRLVDLQHCRAVSCAPSRDPPRLTISISLALLLRCAGKSRSSPSRSHGLCSNLLGHFPQGYEGRS